VPSGNNFPFQPGDAHAYKKKQTPVQAFPFKHNGPPARGSNKLDLTSSTKNGKAHSKKKHHGHSAIQKAAGKRLFGKQPSGFRGHIGAPDK